MKQIPLLLDNQFQRTGTVLEHRHNLLSGDPGVLVPERQNKVDNQDRSYDNWTAPPDL